MVGEGVNIVIARKQQLKLLKHSTIMQVLNEMRHIVLLYLNVIFLNNKDTKSVQHSWRQTDLIWHDQSIVVASYGTFLANVRYR